MPSSSVIGTTTTLPPSSSVRAAVAATYVVTRPRDLRRGAGEVSVCWLKRRWKCGNRECGRKTFTESLPDMPPGRQMTARLRELAAAEVAERGRTVSEG